MKKLSILILTFIFYQTNLFACELISFNNILRINQFIDNKVIKKSSCPQNINEHFTNIIKNSDGKVSSTIINQLIFDKFKIKTEILPNQINVLDLKNIMSRKLDLTSEQKIFQIKSINNINSFSSEEFINIKLISNQSLEIGENNIQISINDRQFWLNLILQQAKNVWVAKDNISPFKKDLSPHDFKSIRIFDHQKKDFFNNIESIQYYKTNKSIEKNTPVTYSHISPLNLVYPGKKVKLHLKGNNINISHNAIAKQNGHYGSIIELENIKSKKKFFAKIIGFNEAEVNL